MRLPAESNQRQVMQAMLDSGVSTRRGIMCSHREEAYREFRLPYPLTLSEHAQDHCVLLPLYPQMTPVEQEQVAAALREAVRSC